jgi:hypothetical protein
MPFLLRAAASQRQLAIDTPAHVGCRLKGVSAALRRVPLIASSIQELAEVGCEGVRCGVEIGLG